MNLSVREGHYDVGILAGPRVESWPSVGSKIISEVCADAGLIVGVLGGPSITVRGVMPLPSTGGTIIAEDSQRRIHRIRAKAIVKFSSSIYWPDPFQGVRSPGLLPLATAMKLLENGKLIWGPVTCILGTGNSSLEFGSRLLERNLAAQVFCLETDLEIAQHAKPVAGWQVYRERFEKLGGKIIYGEPVQLSKVSGDTWVFRVKDGVGVRVIECARVVSAGPFEGADRGLREYPPGSMLFEIVKSSGASESQNVEGWRTEGEYARECVIRILRSLGAKSQKKMRPHLKALGAHQESPWVPQYQGKWMNAQSMQRLQEFVGIPKQIQRKRFVAALECIEDIPCNLCETACPDSAIRINRRAVPATFLIESSCTACGKCLKACPAQAAVMLHEPLDAASSKIVFSCRSGERYHAGELVKLVNRKGESLGSARVIEHFKDDIELVQVEVPAHLVWQARGIQKQSSEVGDPIFETLLSKETSVARVEIAVDAQKRLVREGISVAEALFEMGSARSEDQLLCADGSCGRCSLHIDGAKQLACTSRVRKGMTIDLRKNEPSRLVNAETSGVAGVEMTDALCPCLGITEKDILERIGQGGLTSAQAVVDVTHVGGGKCHGQICLDSFKRVLERNHIDTKDWIDWRLPWVDWKFDPSGSH